MLCKSLAVKHHTQFDLTRQADMVAINYEHNMIEHPSRKRIMAYTHTVHVMYGCLLPRYHHRTEPGPCYDEICTRYPVGEPGLVKAL